MMHRVISIDPSGDGATAFIVANVDYDLKEPIELVNFGILDFRATDEESEKDYNPIKKREIRHNQAKKLIDFVIEQEPDLVIIENFIMYRVQMGKFGRSFITSELIGTLDYALWQKNIPVVRQRASVLRQGLEYYIKEDSSTGEVVKTPKPRKFKEELKTQALKDRGFLVAKKYNRTHILINGAAYNLKDYQVGSKNDHIIMALRHLVYYVDKYNIQYTINKFNKEEGEDYD